MRWNRKIVGWSVAVLAIVVYSLLPVAWITSLSFKQGDDINNQQFWPTNWSLDNYRTVFDTNLFTSALRNSLGISALSLAKDRLPARGASPHPLCPHVSIRFWINSLPARVFIFNQSFVQPPK